jgi:hypothetical protein
MIHTKEHFNIRYYFLFFLLLTLSLILVISLASADVLPKSSAVSNNQVPSTTTVEVVGIIMESTKRQHTITSMPSGGGGFLTSPGASTSSSTYSAETMSNGGYYNGNRDQVFDAGAVGKETFNIDSDSLVTYATDPSIGSSLLMNEEIQLFVSGTARELNITSVNPFVQQLAGKYVGAFDSSYHAGSSISQMTTGAVQRRAEVRGIGIANQTPAELGYDISVRPDVSSGLMYADAHVTSEFGVSIIDGLENTTIAQNVVDMETSSSVFGLIFKFDQFYNARSGIDLG